MSSWYLDWGHTHYVPLAPVARNTAPPQLAVTTRQTIRHPRTNIHDTYVDRLHRQPVAPGPVARDTELTQLPQVPQLTAPIALAIPPPPTDNLYETPEAAIAAMNIFAKPYGFAIATASCTAWNGVKRIVYLCCHREKIHRLPLPPSGRRTRGSDCTFSSILRLQSDGRWLITLPTPDHNHGPFTGATHIIHRRAEVAQWSTLIDAQIRDGKGSTEILRSLRVQDPKTSILLHDIRVYRKKAIQDLAAREQALSMPAFMGRYQVLRSE